jgi:disulfide bond formation protein DsbB
MATESAPSLRFLTLVATGVAFVASAGSLYLSAGMGLVACPLCFYQRSFALATFAALMTGLIVGLGRTSTLAGIALPLAAAGAAVAVFHVSLEARGKLECPLGVLGLGTAPQQSLAVLGLLTALLLIDLLSDRPTQGAVTGLLTLVLGIVLAASCIWTSSPPCPPDYSQPLKGCRPPKQQS